jgi:hypothetical protein
VESDGLGWSIALGEDTLFAGAAFEKGTANEPGTGTLYFFE